MSPFGFTHRNVWTLILLLCITTTALPSPPRQQVFQNDVLPILKSLCFECHGGGNDKGGLQLDQLNPDTVQGDDAEAWHDVLDQLTQGDMPPEKANQPTGVQRQQLTQWITTALKDAAEAKRFQNGRVYARRLTRYEYANSMRDVLGVDLDFAKNLPPEPVSVGGFLNDGATLEMSPTQIEIYLAAARRGLAEAIVSGERPKLITAVQTESSVGNLPTKKIAGHQPVRPEFILDLKEFPRHGEFQLKITARAAIPGGAGMPRMHVSMGHVPGIVHVPRASIGQFDVAEDEQTYTLSGRMEDLPQPGPISFGNSGFKGMIVMVDFVDADGNEIRYPDRKYAQRAPNQKKNAKQNKGPAEPKLAEPKPFGSRLDIEIRSVEFNAPVYVSWPPPSHERLVFEQEESEDSDGVRRLLKRFISKAFRRPASDDEIEQTVELFQVIRQRTDSFEEALRETYASVLVSPHFLYIIERRDATSGAQRISGWELASRLSYFLWSSPPDQQLLDLASDNSLENPEVLDQQVSRMLSDSRSSQLIRHFVDQWLDLGALQRVAVNPEFYPEFDNQLKQHMREETAKYFEEVLRSELSALELLDSDWAMLNRPLASHYGVSGPRGSEFHRVSLKNTSRRGGLLWQAAFHLANSNGEDSHPIKRAVWILDRLLDSPPASPPPEVPDLDAESPDLAKLTLKQQLAVHREKASCSGCHQGIDPWGIPLENFDAIGRWRTEIPKIKKRPAASVDSASVLPDGTSVDGIEELQTYLREHCREKFARSLVKRIMAYGLGRTLDFGDRETTQRLQTRFIESDFRVKSLIADLVQSEAFLTK